MRARGVAALGLAGALALGACTNREVTRPDPEPVTEELLSEATVDPDLLPPGFSESEVPGPINAPFTHSPCDEEIESLAPDEEASHTYTNGDVVFWTTVAWFPGAGAAAEEVFDRVQRACERGARSRTGAEIRAHTLDYGALSDRTVSIRFEHETPGAPIVETAVVVMREGDLLSVIRLTGPRPVNRELLDRTVRDALGELSRVAELTRT